ncbi:GNAT family N-acetyltransferase [Vibrio scophthalmi]|uniref:N-acetyltransferase domain-containing protein n=1 Tax=Vibrio scophthalmi TaxID=45658 RepID=A0A1E3WEQ4_9VIBR|nr:GNAT family N-acetyltransferase [Vibrio scophthalmi]ODS04281.1 hypothetical protein VSF3289_03412 [Vibrio scophthalmi]
MVGRISMSSIKIEKAKNDFDMSQLSVAFRDIAPLYPNFSKWFISNFVPSFHRGEREIIFAHNGKQLCGISLLKKTKEEQKICTFYVLPEFRRNKLGERLLDASLASMNDGYVIISVSKERLSELYPVLSSRGFVLDHYVKGLYRSENIEYFFKIKKRQV